MDTVRTYRFADFEVSILGLKQNGRPLDIDPTPLDVLLYLIAHRNRLVLHAELDDAIWRQAFVSAESHHRAIAHLRHKLGDTSRPRRFIKTTARRGYQFIAPVAETLAEGNVRLLGEHTTPTAGITHTGEVSHGQDRSVFIRDVTVADGSTVRVNEQFTKMWELRNGGSVTWINRFLVRQGPISGRGRLRSLDRVPIPTTMPGDRCIVSVDLTAPPAPGSCVASWKMVDEHGAYCFPGQASVYVSVDVVADRSPDAPS